MRKSLVFGVGIGLALIGAGAFLMARPVLQSAPAAGEAAAEVQVGLGVEKMELKEAATAFTVAPGTRIYAWARVSGCADSKVAFAFFRGDKEMSRQELSVSGSPYRTFAYRSFRAGDAGAWTAKLMAGDTVLGSAAFTVELK